MSLHLERDLDKLKKEILLLGSKVEEAINNSITALHNRQADLAESVIDNEDGINEMEVAIEEECLKILALHQPVAVDLRFIVVVLKVNNDLERMGDLAVNIAKRAIDISGFDPIRVLPDFADTLPGLIRTMVRDALDALVKLDVELAYQVIDLDDQVDEINRRMYSETHKQIMKDPATADRAISMLSASRYMERIADLTTNIAEDVLFMVKGTVVRHDPELEESEGEAE